MPTDPATARFIADQMAQAGDVALRKMFGEYAVYLDAKLVALICDNQLFVKPTAGAVALIADPQMAPPYPGAKPQIVVADEIDDPDRLAALIRAVAHDLPPPKPKVPKKPRTPEV